MIPPPRNVLVSFHYYRKYDLDKLAGLRIVGDSGAYSARMQGVDISNDDLYEWVTRWRHRLAWAASMDVAGDTRLTRHNWLELVNAGVPAVSSLHVGTPPEEMSWYAARGVDFLGLGGIAGGAASWPTQFRWLVSVFRYARAHHPEMRFHGWGVTNKQALQLPFFSVDSTGWSSGYRYGRLNVRDPRSGKAFPVVMNGRETYTPDVAILLREHYGVNPGDVSTSGPHNRKTVVRIAALSASVQEQMFRRMHRKSQCSSPRWGMLGGSPPLTGPHLHLAEGSSDHLEVVRSLG